MHNKNSRKQAGSILLLAFLLILAMFLSCLIGRYHLSPIKILRVLSGTPDRAMDANVFLNVRLPRLLTSAICGASLALAGFIYQELFRNPLASPDILGVGGGASVGAIIAILSGSATLLTRQISAFAGGLVVVLLSLLLAAQFRGNRYMNLIISGMIFSAIANSCIMAMKYLADPQHELAIIDYWLMGSYSLAGWSELISILPWHLCAMSVLYLIRYQIKVLTLGDDDAYSLGISVRRVRITAILAATILVSASVSVSGLVSWIGLIVPHSMRIIFGKNFNANMWQTLLGGAILVTVADTAARSITTTELPISILTTAFGAFCLLLFMLRKRAYYD